MTDTVDTTLPTPLPEKSVNPLLARVRLPGEIHQLPSGGLFYTDGELDLSVKNGEVQIFPMTAIDEVTMRSPDLLFSGEAIDHVIANCVPQVLKPRRLLAKDIDFILAALRKISYGEFFEVNLKHTCENAGEHSYNIPLDKFIKGAKKIDPNTLVTSFKVTLPNSQVVSIHPIRYDAVVEMMQAADPEVDPKKRTDQLIDVIVNMTESVDDVTDRDHIHEWYNTIQVGWSEHINKAIDVASEWGPDFTFTATCKDCGEEIDVTAPIDPVSFFF